MPIVPIDDLDDPRLAGYRALKATNRTRWLDEFVVEGETLLDRLLASRFPVASALATDRRADRIAAKVPGDVPLYVVPHALVDVLVGFNFHRGVLAAGRRRPWPGLAEFASRLGARATVVVCPALDNPENLGAILRIADVFGADALLLGPSCPDPLSRRVLRVSMGTSLRLPTITSADLDGDVARLGASWGFERLATVVDPGAEPFDAFARPDRLALFLGRESAGLEPEWVARCDRRVTIPMRPGAESLNVAVAAGVLLYHYSRPVRPA